MAAAIEEAKRRLAADPEAVKDLPLVPKVRRLVDQPDKAGKPFFDAAMYGDRRDAAGLALRRAEAHLYDDDLDAALEMYRTTAYLMDKESPNASEARQRYIEERHALASAAKKQRLFNALNREMSPRLTAKDPIPKEWDKAIIAEAESDRAELQKDSFNKVYKVSPEKKGSFYVKLYEVGGASPEEIHLRQRQKAEAEVMGAILMNEMGQNSPAARIAVFPDGTVALITRSVENARKLENLTEYELFALRKAYGEQRVIRAEMGDSDGHHKNILVDEHGNVWNMDFDRAIPEGRVSGHFGDWEYESEEQLIEGTIRFAHGRVEKADRRLLSPDFIAHKVWNNSLRRKENYGWMARADQLIRLDDVEDQIARLEKLKSENYRKELIVKFTEAGIDKDNAEDMVDALGQRAEVLRKTIEKETVFGNGPIDISLLFDLSPTKHAMAPMPGTGASLRIAA